MLYAYKLNVIYYYLFETIHNEREKINDLSQHKKKAMKNDKKMLEFDF